MILGFWPSKKFCPLHCPYSWFSWYSYSFFIQKVYVTVFELAYMDNCSQESNKHGHFIPIRYTNYPASATRKVVYMRKMDIEFCNGYISVSPYLTIVSILHPQVREYVTRTQRSVCKPYWKTCWWPDKWFDGSHDYLCHTTRSRNWSCNAGCSLPDGQ